MIIHRKKTVGKKLRIQVSCSEHVANLEGIDSKHLIMIACAAHWSTDGDARMV
jgi:hypothetical protein